METRSGLYQAGVILLLVGAIMSAVGALMMLGFSIGMGAVFANIDGAPGPFFLVFYGIMAVLLVGSSVFGFIAFNKGRQGDASGAFAFGIVSALLPPLQMVPLLGAIFCKVSPEAAQAP